MSNTIFTFTNNILMYALQSQHLQIKIYCVIKYTTIKKDKDEDILIINLEAKVTIQLFLILKLQFSFKYSSIRLITFNFETIYY